MYSSSREVGRTREVHNSISYPQNREGVEPRDTLPNGSDQGIIAETCLLNRKEYKGFFLCFIQFSDILMVTGLGFAQCDDNRQYLGFYNYGYLDYLLSPLASWS